MVTRCEIARSTFPPRSARSGHLRDIYGIEPIFRPDVAKTAQVVLQRGKA